MAEGKLFASHCRRWSSGIKAKRWFFQKFSRGVNSSFGYLLADTWAWDTQDFLWFLASLRIFPVWQRISVGVVKVGLDALLLTAAFLAQFFSCLFFPKALDLHSFWLKQPDIQRFASICACTPRQRICLPRILSCCCAVLWEGQLINAVSNALASPTH